MKKSYKLDGESGITANKCSCSRRTKFIIGGAVALPFLVVIGLLAAVLINAAVLQDPFERVQFSDTPPAFMPSSDADVSLKV